MNDFLREPPQMQFALWKLGYRAFFFVAILAGVALIGLWTIVYSTKLSPTNYYEPIGWHGHEMLFGFAVAVMAGYLLTLSESWSGTQRKKGSVLLLLVLVWAAGRISPLVPDMPPAFIAFIDVVFLPLLALVFTPQRIAKVRFHYNFVFLCLWLMTLANMLIHAQILGILENSAEPGQGLMLYLMLLMVVVLGSQVSAQQVHYSATEKRITLLSVLAMTAFSIVVVSVPDPLILAVMALITALVFASRIFVWRLDKQQSPMMWALYNAYIWIVMGFVLYSLSAYGYVQEVLCLHAFTVGGLGTMSVIIMMHMTLNNRPPRPKTEPVSFSDSPRSITYFAIAIIVVINLAAISRVFIPIFNQQTYSGLILVSSLFWVLTFVLLFLRLAPALTFARADEAPLPKSAAAPAAAPDTKTGSSTATVANKPKQATS